MKSRNRPDLARLTQMTGIEWKRTEHACQALIHSSWSNEHPKAGLGSNERLEYVGDAVLDLIVGHRIFLDCPGWDEGRMSRTRAKVVCEGTLAEAAAKLGLGSLLMMGRGEEAANGRSRPSTLADAVEAIIGALFLDGGLAPCEAFVMRILGDAYREALKDPRATDWKTLLQERLQRNGSVQIVYSLLSSDGPDHARVFHMDVRMNEQVLGCGSGMSKKEAEQAAARQALERVEAEQGGHG